MSEDEQNDDSAERSANAVNRRRLLKGAAAAGVGVAAWSSPNIRTLGATPAYATHTPTTAVVTLLSQCDPLNANCSSNTTCPGTPTWGPASNPGVVTVQNINGSGNDAIVNVSGCVTTTGGSAIVGTQPAGFFCEVVQVRISNNGNSASKYTFNTPSSPGAGNGINDPLVFPAVPVAQGQSCAYFICTILKCTGT